MKIVVDMNLSPQWVDFLREADYECVHWSEIGSARALDREIMEWAITHGYIVFTHDLDFGTILAVTDASSPSVLQVRAQDISPRSIGQLVLSTLKQFEEKLTKGALISIDQKRARARILPFNRD